MIIRHWVSTRACGCCGAAFKGPGTILLYENLHADEKDCFITSVCMDCYKNYWPDGVAKSARISSPLGFVCMYKWRQILKEEPEFWNRPLGYVTTVQELPAWMNEIMASHKPGTNPRFQYLHKGG